MLDSAHLQEGEARYQSRKKARHGHANHSGKPLYSVLDALNSTEHFGRSVRYGQQLELVPGIRATFIDAGHILGSACIHLELAEQGQHRSLLFSGDLGNAERPFLRSPATPPRADVVVMETMAVITLLLVVSGNLAGFAVPFWVILLCASAIMLGTASGGWRINRTVSFIIYRLRPLHAFDSQLAAATVISAATAFGGPVSTTHVVSSSIMGIGAAERSQAVRWGKATEIVFTWFVTLPAATMVAALTYSILRRSTA
jgi:hypothetical protein